jgi:hypothetical protein
MGVAGLTDVVFFVNNTGVQLKVLAITARYSAANGSALTATIKKVPSGTVVASGTALHSTAIDLNSTTNTNSSPTLGDISALTLSDTDALGIDVSGAGTSIADLHVTVLLEPLNG